MSVVFDSSYRQLRREICVVVAEATEIAETDAQRIPVSIEFEGITIPAARSAIHAAASGSGRVRTGLFLAAIWTGSAMFGVRRTRMRLAFWSNALVTAGGETREPLDSAVAMHAEAKSAPSASRPFATSARSVASMSPRK